MSDLKVRRVRFDLAADDIPLNWNPNRPSFAMICNLISLFAPGFEKFIVEATREAIPLMGDSEVIEEANLYVRQEAQHSAAHVRHVNALARRWPGLREVMDDIVASYDRLTATKPLHWRLAYTAVIENTFTPYFKVFLDHDDKLFATGDERVASLLMWHFVEEIEHRSSALTVYNEVHGSFPYRLKTMGGVIKHLGEVLSIFSRGIQRHVPAEEGGELGRLLPDGFSPRALRAAKAAERKLLGPGQATYAGVPRREIIAMIIGLIRSQGPKHDPEFENVPVFADRWFRRYDQEPRSAAHWYSVGAASVSP